MANESSVSLTRKDYIFGVLSGLLIGLLFLPILKAAKPDLYDKFAIFVIPFFLIGTPAGLIVASLISKKISIIWQIAKFGVIGVLNTLVDLGFLALITLVVRQSSGIEAKATLFVIGTSVVTYYSLYKATSFLIANVNSYFWNKHWTFNQNPEKKTHAQFLQFFAVSIVGFIINVLIASAIFKTLGTFSMFTEDQQGLMGAAAGSIIGLAWNFIGYKFIVFKEKVA
jgi:putative flippase GtrA